MSRDDTKAAGVGCQQQDRDGSYEQKIAASAVESRQERRQAEIQDRAVGDLEMRLTGVVAFLGSGDDHFTERRAYQDEATAVALRRVFGALGISERDHRVGYRRLSREGRLRADLPTDHQRSIRRRPGCAGVVGR